MMNLSRRCADYGNYVICPIIDVDECLLRTDTCGNRSTANCTNTIGSYRCMCLPGYTGEEGNCTGKPFPATCTCIIMCQYACDWQISQEQPVLTISG